MVVKEGVVAIDLRRQRNENLNLVKDLRLVEMGGLEPPTPYMRSKCSTS
jgi:hypothetical protein